MVVEVEHVIHVVKPATSQEIVPKVDLVEVVVEEEDVHATPVEKRVISLASVLTVEVMEVKIHASVILVVKVVISLVIVAKVDLAEAVVVVVPEEVVHVTSKYLNNKLLLYKLHLYF